ncbi:hypothetical protein HYH03_001527 [Edaphochlamys debaryana]|uniref:Uncharacterized protein n=1 Tax=Edaphochlamys debaryana TaxID=47281 RepID=A0A835YLJ7_9CHLO|nr:hypothetical protein HYH03_001527 [Edaphochlamys debaryana]|eukprot:KAG2500765.1 hypothetical protein HYH03_001527 [Edaphochlamys debaryana]
MLHARVTSRASVRLADRAARPHAILIGVLPARQLVRAAGAEGAGYSSSGAAGPGNTTPQEPTAAEPSAAASGNGAASGHVSQQPAAPPPTSFLGRVKRFFTGDKLDKERLAALGFGAFSAYGVISNINAGILITIAWLTIVRTTGLTPLDGANWPKFLAVYAGLWVGSNFLRPIRLTLAIAAAPAFDACISWVSRKTRVPKVPAFVVMLVCIAIATTSLLMATIAALGGFPPGCRMPWEAFA